VTDPAGNRNGFDEGHTLALGDWVKFELTMRGRLSHGVLLSIDEPLFSEQPPGPRIHYSTGDVTFYTINHREVDLTDTMVFGLAVQPKADGENSLGWGSYKRTTKPNELLFDVTLELDRESVRDVIDHLLRAPYSTSTLAGEVVRLSTEHLPSLVRIHEFSLSSES